MHNIDSMADSDKTMTFELPIDLGKWLQDNHATESELLIKMFKRALVFRVLTGTKW